MTARKRASHVAHARRYKGREANFQKQGTEAAERDRRRDERKRAEMALSEAQRKLRAEEKAARQQAQAAREQDRAVRQARERRILLLRREVAERERELSAYAGVMVAIPVPEPAREVRRKPDDQAVAWSRGARSPARRSVAELRRLNGLD